MRESRSGRLAHALRASAPPVADTSKDTAVNSSPPIAKHALAAEIEEHLLEHRRRRPRRRQPDRPDAGRRPGGAPAAVAALGRRPRRAERAAKARRVYYLSMEFLIGRTLSQRAGRAGPARAAPPRRCAQHAQTLEDVADREPDAALGNGGLGRLAACFLDSMATLGLPSFGYGIRYEYGMFAQDIQNGCQVEHPDPWLADGTPWEFPRAGISYPVRFGGWVEHVDGTAAVAPRRRSGGQGLRHGGARPRHRQVSTLRLWKAVAPAHIDLHAFNTGDYARAAEREERVREHLLGALPERQHAGRARAAAAPGVLLRRRVDAGHRRPPPATSTARCDNLADKVAIHLNDTHPAIGVAELMRLLCDEHGMPWAAGLGAVHAACSRTPTTR